MLTKIDICNIALGLIGTSFIKSFEEKSKEALVCKQYYDNCKDKLLSRYDWSFARKIAKLAKVVNEDKSLTQNIFKNVFQLPTDMISIIKVFESNSYDFVVSEDKLLTNLDSITILYTSNGVNVHLYTPLFIDSLTSTLASDLAVTITDNYQLSANLKILAEEKLKVASVVDANSFSSNTRDHSSNLSH